MLRRTFLKLGAGAAAALVAAETIPAFETLPTTSTVSVVIPRRRAYLVAMKLWAGDHRPEPATVWITDGTQRLAVFSTVVRPNHDVPVDIPLVLTDHQSLVVEGNVYAQSTWTWFDEDAKGLFPPAHVSVQTDS